VGPKGTHKEVSQTSGGSNPGVTTHDFYGAGLVLDLTPSKGFPRETHKGTEA